MRKYIIVCLLCLMFCTVASAQGAFQKGYFKDNDGKLTECLIKDPDVRNNPTSFRYKLAKGAPVQSANISDVSEFAVGENRRFVRKTVEMEMSSMEAADLKEDPAPNFETRTVFLKVLADGASTLYEYSDNLKTRYFFTLGDEEPEALVYRQYIRYIDGAKNVMDNNKFRYQIYGKLGTVLGMEPFTDLPYKAADLKKLIVSYNRKVDNNTFEEMSAIGRKTVSLSVIASLSRCNGKLWGPVEGQFNDFGVKTCPTLGVEGEFTLPFFRNKVAVTLDPAYTSYMGTLQTTTNRGEPYTNKLYLRYVDVPLGLRYKMFMGKNSMFFVDARYNIGFGRSNLAHVYPSSSISNLKLATWCTAGVGYKFADRVSLGAYYSYGGNFANKYVNYTIDASRVTVTLSYTILK